MGKFARKKRSALSLQNPGAISYSVQMRPNGMNENDPERAYASLQYAGTVKLEQLASHISEHGCSAAEKLRGRFFVFTAFFEVSKRPRSSA